MFFFQPSVIQTFLFCSLNNHVPRMEKNRYRMKSIVCDHEDMRVSLLRNKKKSDDKKNDYNNN